MRGKLPAQLRLHRIELPPFENGDDRNGAFLLPERFAEGGRTLKVIVGDGELWDHVSANGLLCEVLVLARLRPPRLNCLRLAIVKHYFILSPFFSVATDGILS